MHKQYFKEHEKRLKEGEDFPTAGYKTVILLLMISSFRLFGQDDIYDSISDTSNAKSGNIGIFYGLSLDKFDEPIYGIYYINSLMNKVAYTFELWTFVPEKPNAFGVLSAGLRYYTLEIANTKLYIQGGLGISVFSPIAYGEIGLNFSQLFISLRSVPFVKIHPTYLTIGIKI